MMSEIPNCDCYETYPGPGPHRQGCEVSKEIERLRDEIERLKERFDFKGALVDTVANQQARIEKLEAVLEAAKRVCADGTMDGIRAAAILISLDPLEELEQAIAKAEGGWKHVS